MDNSSFYLNEDGSIEMEERDGVWEAVRDAKWTAFIVLIPAFCLIYVPSLFLLLIILKWVMETYDYHLTP